MYDYVCEITNCPHDPAGADTQKEGFSYSKESVRVKINQKLPSYVPKCFEANGFPQFVDICQECYEVLEKKEELKICDLCCEAMLDPWIDLSVYEEEYWHLTANGKYVRYCRDCVSEDFFTTTIIVPDDYDTKYSIKDYLALVVASGTQWAECLTQNRMEELGTDEFPLADDEIRHILIQFMIDELTEYARRTVEERRQRIIQYRQDQACFTWSAAQDMHLLVPGVPFKECVKIVKKLKYVWTDPMCERIHKEPVTDAASLLRWLLEYQD